MLISCGWFVECSLRGVRGEDSGMIIGGLRDYFPCVLLRLCPLIRRPMWVDRRPMPRAALGSTGLLSGVAELGWDHAGSGGGARGGCPGPLPSRPCGKPGVFPALVGPHPRPRAERRGCWASWGLPLFPCRSAVWCNNETLCVPGWTWTALWLCSLDGAGSITGVGQRGQELPTPQGVCPD